MYLQGHLKQKESELFTKILFINRSLEEIFSKLTLSLTNHAEATIKHGLFTCIYYWKSIY